MNIGEKIKYLREKNALTQKELSDKIKINHSVLSRIESGERPVRDEEIMKIADILEVSTDYLLGRTKAKDNNKSEQATYIESLKLDTPEDAIKFILQQPSIMEFGGYSLKDMNEDEIMALANDLLFAMKLSLEKHKKK